MNNRKILLKIFPALLALLLCLTAFGYMGCSRAGGKPIVLLTDFGSADYRASQLKGIIYSNFAEASVVEASENVPAFDIATGAFMLDVAAREFPANAVFVGVVSPYALGNSSYIVVTNDRGQVFVLPDNGLLTYIAAGMGVKSVYQVTNQSLFDEPIAQLSAERLEGTVGARLASGYKAENVGPALANPVKLDVETATISGNKLLGAVVYVDNYGNCVTNISADTATQFGLTSGTTIQIVAGESAVSAKIGNTYADVSQGKEIALVNNNLGLLQLSINLGNFAKTYAVKAGVNIEITK